MKKKIIRCGTILLFSGLVVGGAVIYHHFNISHKDVQAAALDFQLEARELVNEYLASAQMANNKYVLEEGDFKILTSTGTVASNDKDMKQQGLVFLKDSGENADIDCTSLESIHLRASQKRRVGNYQVTCLFD